MSSVVSEALSEYCSLTLTEEELLAKCDAQLQTFIKDEHVNREIVEQWVLSSGQTCIPVRLDSKEVYLRVQTKSTPRSVTEEAFRKVIQVVPSQEELQRIVKDHADWTTVQVYIQWILNQLRVTNVSQKTSVMLTPTKQRVPKGQNLQVVTVPDQILQATRQWQHIQSNVSRFQKFKKAKVDELRAKRLAVEPILHQHFQTKETSTQKVVLDDVDDSKNSFRVTRVLKTIKPSLSLSQSKPLIATVVQQTLANPALHGKYNYEQFREWLNNGSGVNVLFQTFKEQLLNWKTQNAAVRPEIRAVRGHSSGEKRKHS